MAECPVKLEKLDFGSGKGTVWRITPIPLPPTCTCKSFIDGKETTGTGNYGPFHVSGWTSTSLLIEPPPTVKGHIRFVVTCEDPECSSTINVSLPMVASPPKDWDWLVFLGKVLGGTAGGALSSTLFNWWTGAAILVCIVTGALGGAAGSAFGQFLVWIFDDPKINWNIKSSFLFCMFFTLLFSMVFGLLSIELERESASEIFNRVTFGITAMSGLLATMLTGVLNNLRNSDGDRS
jgi:hypothetical protein